MVEINKEWVTEFELAELMYNSWRAGYKHSKILEKAQAIDPSIDSKGVKLRFRQMFDAHLGTGGKHDDEKDTAAYIAEYLNS